MSSPNSSVRVKICGEEFPVRSDMDPDTTIKIADYVHNKIMELRKSSSVRNDFKIAVLTALNIAGEYYQYREEYEESHDYKAKYEQVVAELNEVQNRVAELNSKINDLMGE